MCTELWHLTGYDPKKIIGSGCGLDSARLRTEISKKVGVSPKSIDAYMIGEHGFSQLAAFKAATIAGKSLNELQAENLTSTPLTTWRSRNSHARAAT